MLWVVRGGRRIVVFLPGMQVNKLLIIFYLHRWLVEYSWYIVMLVGIRCRHCFGGVGEPLGGEESLQGYKIESKSLH